MTEVHQFVTLLPAKPLEVKAANLDHDQYWVEGKSEGYGWRDTNVSFSGYFGSYGPHMFAAAPDLAKALAPFAKVYEMDISSGEDDADLFQVAKSHNRAPKLTVGDFKRAYQAIYGLEART